MCLCSNWEFLMARRYSSEGIAHNCAHLKLSDAARLVLFHFKEKELTQSWMFFSHLSCIPNKNRWLSQSRVSSYIACALAPIKALTIMFFANKTPPFGWMPSQVTIHWVALVGISQLSQLSQLSVGISSFQGHPTWPCCARPNMHPNMHVGIFGHIWHIWVHI